MLILHIRLFVPLVIVVLASCDAADRPKVCRGEAHLRAMKEAEAYVRKAEEAVVRARMLGPSPRIPPHIQNVRPPAFEPDPIAAAAVGKLQHARFTYAQAIARCRDG